MLAKKNNGRVLPVLGALLVVLAAGGYFVFRNLQSTALVKLATRDTAVDAVTGSVTVFADGGVRELKIQVLGKVATTNIKPGTPFKKGDVLVSLDTKELDRQQTEARRKYDSDKARAKITLENNPEKKITLEKLENAKRLFKLGSASEEDVKSLQRAIDAIDTKYQLTEFDDKKADEDFKVAEEDFKLLREKMQILAPIDGTIEGALTWDGALVTAGQTLVTVISSRRVVAAKIGEESFGRVKVGQAARLRLLTYGSQNYEATVSELLPTADETQRFTVYLDVKVDAELLKPGSTGEVTITIDSRPNAVTIPRRALFDGNKAFVVRDGRVERRELETGYVALNKVEVRKGIAVGEAVILDNLETFRDGQRVRTEVVP
ncbi:MAG: efflux RND transporter periplasmic adaptor subunit [Opitutaceae bacterium]|nr:efflux RND transporter periplasmic adaptor subunit [Opitutaceae bacterium]